MLSSLSNPHNLRVLGRVVVPVSQVVSAQPGEMMSPSFFTCRHFRGSFKKDKPLSSPLLETPKYMREVSLFFCTSLFLCFPLGVGQIVSGNLSTFHSNLLTSNNKVYTFWYRTEKNVSFLDKESVVNTLLWGHADLLEGTVVSMIKPGDRVMQTGATYGELTTKSARAVGKGLFDCIDITPIQVC